MKIVGLTGGIGSGKTTVAAMFAQLGVAVFNSDEQAKNLIATNEQVKQQIIATFGAQSYTSDGYNRPYIAQIVFHNPDKLAQLNAIVHWHSTSISGYYSSRAYMCLKKLPFFSKAVAIKIVIIL